MSFGDIIGHAGVLRILRGAHERDKVHHAFVFSGPDGVGKARVAFELFKLLNCAQRGDDPCDRCPPCRKITADGETVEGGLAADELTGGFPDLMVLRPDKQFIRIEQVREMIKRVPYRPVEGRWKCVLVREAHQLHETAANALLKTLEEPPPATLFVLVTHAPQLLLATVLSRCQPVRFGALGRGDVEALLGLHTDIAPAEAAPIAAMAEGSIGRALDLVRNPVVQERGTWLRDLVQLPERPDHDLFAQAEKIASNRPHFPVYLDILRSWFRDQLLLREGLPRETLTNADLADHVERAAAHADQATLRAALAHIDTAQQALRGNANATLTADWLLLHLFGSGKG